MKQVEIGYLICFKIATFNETRGTKPLEIGYL